MRYVIRCVILMLLLNMSCSRQPTKHLVRTSLIIERDRIDLFVDTKTGIYYIPFNTAFIPIHFLKR